MRTATLGSLYVRVRFAFKPTGPKLFVALWETGDAWGKELRKDARACVSICVNSALVTGCRLIRLPERRGTPPLFRHEETIRNLHS